MSEKIYEGETLKEATQKACEDLRVSEEMLEVKVLEKPAGLLMNLLRSGTYKISAEVKEGGKNAREQENKGEEDEESIGNLKEEYRNPRGNDDKGEKQGRIYKVVSYTADEIKTTIMSIIKHIDSDAQIETQTRDDEMHFNIVSEKSSILIGKNGETLSALQYLVIKMLTNNSSLEKKIEIDVEGYKKRKRRKMIDMAKRVCDDVRQMKKPISLDPMPSHERWIIHNELTSERGVVTKSFGEGRDRRVVIIPDKFKNMEEKLLVKYFKP
ncbi:MAG: RNA-binding cell elongation regulator Jag/EloR [Pseudomonadota bacterium]